ncbi:MAG: polysaccharide deacetylase family protein [Bacteroidia bacterium]|nr:polysaccharide deacetylase family protein [Bacteroidia bacterium]
MISKEHTQIKMDIWSIFTAEGERSSSVRDQYGRSPHLLANHSPAIPSVSNYLTQQGFKPEYPEGKEWGVLLSHDVDWLNYVGLSGRNLMVRQAKRLLKGQVSDFLKGWVEGKNRRAAEYRLELLLEAHEKRNIHSSYFFLALEAGDEDFNYLIEDAQGDVKMVLEAGSEAGLHGGHAAYNSVEILSRELNRIRPHVPELRGYRNHYLRFDIHQSWNLLAEAGFEYDATFGFAGFPGFRNGMCHPFRPFDPKTSKYLDIVEFPLHVMDVSLFNYLGLAPDAAFEVVRSFAHKVKAQNGVFSILWHNNYLTGEWGAFYLKVLDFLTRQEAYISTHSQMLDWWKAQGYIDQMENILNETRTES